MTHTEERSNETGAGRRRAESYRNRRKRDAEYDAWVAGILASHLELKANENILCIEDDQGPRRFPAAPRQREDDPAASAAPQNGWVATALKQKGHEPTSMQFQNPESSLDSIKNALKDRGGKGRPVYIDGIQIKAQSSRLRVSLEEMLGGIAFNSNPRVVQRQEGNTSWRELLLCPIAQALANGRKAIVAVSDLTLSSSVTQKARVRLIGSGIVERVIFLPAMDMRSRRRDYTSFLLLSEKNDNVVFEDYRHCLEGGLDNPAEPAETTISINDLLLDEDVGLDSGSLDYRPLRPSYTTTLKDLNVSFMSGTRLPDRRAILKDEPVPIGKSRDTFRYVSITDFKDDHLAEGGSYIDVEALYNNPNCFAKTDTLEEYVQYLREHRCIKAGDVLVQRVTPGTISEVVFVSQTPEGMTLIPSDNVTVIYCKEESTLDPAFLAAYLNGKYGIKLIGIKAGRRGLLHFGGREFLKLPIYTPPSEEQEEIGSQYREITEQIAEHYREIEKLLAERDKIVERAAGPGKDE